MKRNLTAFLIALAVILSGGITAAAESGIEVTVTAPTETEVTSSVTGQSEETSAETTGDTSAENTDTEQSDDAEDVSVTTDSDEIKDEFELELYDAPAAAAGDNYVGISIDGTYDDWNDKPHSKIHYAWDADNYFHLGALFRDENYVYLHVKMSDRSYTTFNGYNYCFTVDGIQTFVAVVPPEGEDYNADGDTPLVVRAQNGYTLINDAAGVLTRHPGKSDEWEIRIPLSFFTPDPDSVSTITFYCSNLGPQSLIATGTPTMPFVLAGAGLVIAAGRYAAYRRKNKKKADETKEG